VIPLPRKAVKEHVTGVLTPMQQGANGGVVRCSGSVML
jgi:hypothetical protein